MSSRGVQTLSQGLGTLSRLPREIRDKIYGFTLYICNDESYNSYTRAGLLQASRQAYQEAIISLYAVNEFSIFVMEDRVENGWYDLAYHGFKIEFAHANYNPISAGAPYAIELPAAMLKYVRDWHLVIAPLKGIQISDIKPTWPKLAGEKYLLDALAEACSFLTHCPQIHQLFVAFRVLSTVPYETKVILDQIMSLRNVRRTVINISGSYSDGWRLKESYCSYMSRTMALPEGIEAPEYTFSEGDSEGDPEDEDEGEKEIFEFFEIARSDVSLGDSIDILFNSLHSRFSSAYAV